MPGMSISTAVSGSGQQQSVKTSFVTTGVNIGTTETPLTIPAGAKSFSIRTGSQSKNHRLRISNQLNGTLNVLTSLDITMGAVYSEDGLLLASDLTIYIVSNKPSTDVQLTIWS